MEVLLYIAMCLPVYIYLYYKIKINNSHCALYITQISHGALYIIAHYASVEAGNELISYYYMAYI